MRSMRGINAPRSSKAIGSAASDEDLRQYQLDCVDRGVSPITLNATITGLKFFFEMTLKRPEPRAITRYLPPFLDQIEQYTASI